MTRPPWGCPVQRERRPAPPFSVTPLGLSTPGGPSTALFSRLLRGLRLRRRLDRRAAVNPLDGPDELDIRPLLVGRVGEPAEVELQRLAADHACVVHRPAVRQAGDEDAE